MFLGAKPFMSDGKDSKNYKTQKAPKPKAPKLSAAENAASATAKPPMRRYKDSQGKWQKAFTINGVMPMGAHRVVNEVLTCSREDFNGGYKSEFPFVTQEKPVVAHTPTDDEYKAGKSYSARLSKERDGKDYGTLVDKQIGEYLRGERQKACPEAVYVQRALVNLGLTMVKHQAFVFDERLKMGTAADLLCQRGDPPRLVVVEIKTGYSDAEKYHAPFRIAKYTGVPTVVSLADLHQLQCAVTTILAMCTFPDRNFEYGLVIRPHRKGVDVYTTSKHLMEHHAQVAQCMAEYAVAKNARKGGGGGGARKQQRVSSSSSSSSSSSASASAHK